MIKLFFDLKGANMNKILKIAIVVVLCLIVVLTVVLVATQGGANNGGTTTTTTTKPTPSNPPACEHVDTTPKDDKCDKCGETMPGAVIPGDYTETNDIVYVTVAGLNLRSEPAKKDGNEVGWVEIDTKLERLGYYTNGWSKVKYNGKECYVSTDCLTKSKPIASFTSTNETVYFTKGTYAYTKPSHLEPYSVADFTFKFGESTKRIGVATEVYVAEDGKEYTFAKIEFTVTNNGKQETVVRYVNNAYLSTTKPTQADPDAGITFVNNDSILVSKGTQKIRKSAIYVAGSDDEVYEILKQGTELQAVARGTESDGTIWYKVKYDGQILYVIYQSKDSNTGKYKDPYFTIKGSN
jgi:uncharacterized protein YgiM (DUF1202 family)